MRKTTVYLSEDTDRRMRRTAKRLGLSRAAMTRAALEEYLERRERDGTLPPSVGAGENPDVSAADYEARLARLWRPA